MQKALFDSALERRRANTVTIDRYEDFVELMKNENKFVHAHWDGTRETEERVKKRRWRRSDAFRSTDRASTRSREGAWSREAVHAPRPLGEGLLKATSGIRATTSAR